MRIPKLKVGDTVRVKGTAKIISLDRNVDGFRVAYLNKYLGHTYCHYLSDLEVVK